MHLHQRGQSWFVTTMVDGVGSLRLTEPPFYPRGGEKAVVTHLSDPSDTLSGTSLRIRITEMRLDGTFDYRIEDDGR